MTCKRFACFVTMVIACALVFSTTADAQSNDELEQARQRFRVAAAALNEGRPAEACEDLEAVREVIDSAAVRWNLALCSRALGRYAAARVHLDVFLDMTDDEARRATARDLRSALSARLVRLSLSAPQHAVVRLDGVERESIEEPIVLDPGRHRVQVAAEGFTPFDHTFEASSGESVQLIATLSPLVVEPVDVDVAPVEPVSFVHERSSMENDSNASSVPVTRRWWFWTAISVVVAGAAVGTGIVVARGNTTLPGVQIETLR